MVRGCVMHVLENVCRGKLKPLVRSTIFRIRVKRVESKYRYSGEELVRIAFQFGT